VRIASYFTALIVIFYFLQVNPIYAAAEVTKPTIESMSVDKKEPSVGDTVKINIKIKEYQDFNYLNLYYTSPVTSKGITVKLSFNPETKSYEGSFLISDYVESGEYTPHMLSLYGSELATIYSYEYGHFDNGGFHVTNTRGTELIESVSISKKEVVTGDTVKLRLKTSDHQGINYMNSYFRSPITNQTLTVSLNYNPETDLFEGDIPITSITESGTYTLFMLNTYEAGGNTTAFYDSNYGDTFQNGDFTVSGTNIENIIENITVDKKEVTSGNVINLIVKSPKLVGINYMNIYYSSPVTGNSFSVRLDYNSATMAFEGSYLIPNDFELGTYSLFMLGLYDSFGNTTALYESNYPVLNNGNFVFYKAPNAPFVNKITENSTSVSGTSESNMEVFVKIGSTIIGRGKTDFYGNFSVNIPMQAAGTDIRVVVRDRAGHYSSYTIVKVLDITAPLAPVVNGVTDVDTLVTGKAESATEVFVKVGTTIIGRGKSDLLGNFSAAIPNQSAGTKVRVVVRDGSSNYSPYTTIKVADVTVPLAPLVNKITEMDTFVTGKAEPSTEVFVKVGTTIIGRDVTDSKGNFNVAIPRQTAGVKVRVVVRDDARHYSEYTVLTVVK
jgi:hypothetical protein